MMPTEMADSQIPCGAIVLGLGVTGLATARALAAFGVNVYAVSFSAQDPGRATRQCRVVDQPGLDDIFQSSPDAVRIASELIEAVAKTGEFAAHLRLHSTLQRYLPVRRGGKNAVQPL